MHKVFFYCGSVYLLLLAAVSLCAFFLSEGEKVENTPVVSAQEEERVVTTEVKETVSKPILFVGDVFLGRNVEREMDAHGATYPFEGVADFLSGYPFVIGNFEAVIPPRHVPTPSMTFQFSVATTVVPSLKEYGFTHMTLANNHAYDYGEKGYTHTVTTLEEGGIGTGGSPEQVTIDDVFIVDAEGMRVAVIPLYAVFATPSVSALTEVFAYAKSVSDMQVAVIHWGDEYVFKNNAKQSRIAHQVVDLGADAVIGHHPHVIQNIELYRTVPIFYSLGNFIFDQYWNTDVKTGLAVSMTRNGDSLEYALFPVYSERSNPHVLQGAERAQVLTTIASQSDASLVESLEDGVFSVPFTFLASE